MTHVEDRWYNRVGGRMVPTRRKDHGLRWRARWTDPDGRERSKSFALKNQAETFLVNVGADMLRGSYIDPDAGRVTLGKYVTGTWLPSRTCDATTLESLTHRLNRHVLPQLGSKRLDQLARSPSAVQQWVRGLPVGPSYAGQILTLLSSVLGAAVDDGLIARNPCQARSVQPPRVVRRKVVPWTSAQVAAVRAQLEAAGHGRFAAMVDCGAGLGMRQGEIFGLPVDAVDFRERMVHVRQQVRWVAGKPVFAAPKGQKERDVPLPDPVRRALAAHMLAYPARQVTLPWRDVAGKPRSCLLLFTGVRGGAVSRSAFNSHVWQPARRGAGIPDGDAERTGMHQLRHHWASVLLAGGVDIRALSEYLGHHDPAFTLRVYAHLMPGADDRARQAIEAALRAVQAPQVADNLKNL